MLFNAMLTLSCDFGVYRLEFENVYLIEFDKLPSARTVEYAGTHPEFLVQEYKLMYVMLTRTKNNLFFCKSAEKAGAPARRRT